MKHTDFILISSQEELNLLAEVVEGVEVDALLVEEPYVAFIEDVLHIVPLSKLEEGHKFYNAKPRKFAGWYRREKEKFPSNLDGLNFIPGDIETEELRKGEVILDSNETVIRKG